MDRDEFMDVVYSELSDDSDNCRANRIIDAADEYAEHAKAQGLNLSAYILRGQAMKRAQNVELPAEAQREDVATLIAKSVEDGNGIEFVNNDGMGHLFVRLANGDGFTVSVEKTMSHD